MGMDFNRDLNYRCNEDILHNQLSIKKWHPGCVLSSLMVGVGPWLLFLFCGRRFLGVCEKLSRYSRRMIIHQFGQLDL